jgi:uncharacterized protein YaaN involved in tellurite resistance
MLNQLRNKDVGAVGDILSNLVAELKTFDKSINRPQFFDFLRSVKAKIIRIKADYTRVEQNVAQVEVQMEKHYQALSKDIILFDKLYEQNEQYFRELSLCIYAGEEKLADLKETALTVWEKEMTEHLEKKINDLKISRMISLQGEMLRTTTTRIAEENERSVVDIETLRKANDDLFATIGSVLDIQEEGRHKRQAAEQELLNIENQLKQYSK